MSELASGLSTVIFFCGTTMPDVRLSGYARLCIQQQEGSATASEAAAWAIKRLAYGSADLQDEFAPAIPQSCQHFFLFRRAMMRMWDR